MKLQPEQIHEQEQSAINLYYPKELKNNIGVFYKLPINEKRSKRFLLAVICCLIDEKESQKKVKK